METITTRDLVHRSKEVRKRLAAGATLRWTSHGKSVAVLSSGKNLPEKSKPDWISRARAAGAVNQSPSSVGASVYRDRD
jgi:antitoxin (DNA-binding transcriptional repressor) of toxin-antitoxin stability system